MTSTKIFVRAAFLATIILALLPKLTSAQGISSSVTEGCAPLASVQFNNTFTNPTGITWNFGDGASSNLANPTHSFANPGTFNVTFNATSGGSPVSANLTITVYAAPNVSFTVDPNGVCLGQAVQFTDASTGGSGSNMANWQWDFGDGSPITAGVANPSKTFNNPGFYNVTLIGTDANGCQGTSTVPQAVAVSTPPTLAITTSPSPLLACVPPFTASFTNNSTSNSPSGGGLTWQWNFGNGQNSTAANPPPVTYTTTGTFTITVTATDNVGCSATQSFPVSVQQPTAELTAINDSNGVWCGFVEFEVEGTPGGQFNYGNGMTGFQPFHTYTTAGVYNVTYSVSAQGCSAQASTSVVIEIPTGTITSDPGYACFKPVEFSYSLESSSNIAAYEWILSSGDTSDVANPTQMVDYPGPNNYSINGLVVQLTTVNFTTVNGCEGTATILDSLALPNALFYPDKTNGCAPLTVNFEDKSSNHFYHELVSWEWHWGDGNTFSSTSTSDPTHMYLAEGEYLAFLIVTNDAGCVDTSFTHLIEVGVPVNHSFVFVPASPCPNEPVQIANTSADTDKIDFYNYVGDDNTLFSCAEVASPLLVFNTVAGTFPITQQVEYNGCISTTTQQITVKGPIGKVSHECNCENPLDYTFEAEVSGADSWTWDFGDGTVIENSTSQLQSHSYASVDDYWVVLTSFSSTSGCAPYIDSLLIKARNIQASLNVPDQVCAGVEVDLEVIATGGSLPGEVSCYPRYLWKFNDGNRPSQTIPSSTTHIYQGNDTNVLEVFVKDDNECVVKLSQEVTVFGITPQYAADTLTGCPVFEVNFTDLSTSDTTIISWNWNFGDGTSSNMQNPSHLFQDSPFGPNNQPLPYNISLTVTNELGCEAVINEMQVQPLGPNPAFQANSPSNICEGDAVNFIPTGSNVNFHTYAWEYGNGLTSTGSNGSSIFAEAGSYAITLEVTDTTGCMRSRTLNLVNVQAYPTALIQPSFGPDEILCYPVAINFSDVSTINPFGSRSWNLGIGGPNLTIPAVGTTYLVPGLYDVTLSVQTTFGCADSDTLTVKVEGPVAEMVVNPLAICPGGSIAISLADTSDLAFWEFDFGDGNDASNTAPVSHTYDETFIPASGATLLTLVMYSPDSACASARTEPLIIEQVIARFNRNNESAATDSIHCIGIPDIFTSTSSPNAIQFNWSLSTGQTFNTANTPSFNLPAGDHTVQLIVTSALGCQDTISKGMTIHPLPEPTVNEGEICRGEGIALVATGGETYSWQPTTGIDFPNNAEVFASPSLTTTYTVTVTDTNDCVQTVNSLIFVFQPPPSIERDTILRIGDTDFTGFDLGPLYTYTWSPNIYLECDTCAETTFRPLENTQYTLTLEDVQGCFAIESYFYFEILPVASVDVPQAFSPNGDGINDVLFVKGWGIEEMLSFRIFNRWGEMVFETNDINQGWDGRYKGVIQNPDSYAYVVLVKNYIFAEPQSIKGFVDIVR